MLTFKVFKNLNLCIHNFLEIILYMKIDFWGELKMHGISLEFLFYTAQKKTKTKTCTIQHKTGLTH